MTTIARYGVDENARTRVLADAEAARTAGFRLPEPIYAAGTLVNSWGVANFQRSRLEFEKMAPAGDALDGFRAQIASEDRQNLIVKANDLKMAPSGYLTLKSDEAIGLGDEAFGLEEQGFLGLASRVTPGGARYLAECPTFLRATNLNYWSLAADEKKEVMLRHRGDQEEGGRKVWAATGPKYADIDASVIAEMLLDSLPIGARAEVIYDGMARTKINVFFHSDVKAERAAAGEIFKAGITFTTSDDGTEAIRGRTSLLRNLCLNLIILGRSTVSIGEQAHRGDKDKVRAAVKDMIASANQNVAHFAEAWGRAERDRVIDDGKNPQDTFEALVTRGLVKVPGTTKENLVNALTRAWKKEPGYTRRSIVNALTRAAHESPWKSPWIEEQLEEQAGKLLYVKTLNLN